MNRTFEEMQLGHEAMTAGEVERAGKHFSWQEARPTTMLGHTVMLFAAQLFARKKHAG